MFRKILVLAIVNLGLLACVSSQASPPCERELEKFCQRHLHQETELDCLQRQKSSPDFSAACQTALEPKQESYQQKKASWEKVVSVCQKDILAQCADENKMGDQARKALQVCLMMLGPKLEPACKTDLNRHIRSFQNDSIKEIE